VRAGFDHESASEEAVMNQPGNSISRAEVVGGQIRPIVAFTVQFGAIPHEDSIAHAMGFLGGYAGDPLVGPGERRKDLAKAYVTGHRLGRAVKTGKQPMPEWARSQDPKEAA
jgi:hypothetical protein